MRKASRGAAAAYGFTRCALTRCVHVPVDTILLSLLLQCIEPTAGSQRSHSLAAPSDMSHDVSSAICDACAQIGKPDAVAVIPVSPLTDTLDDFLVELKGLLNENQITQRPVQYVFSSNTSVTYPLCQGQVRAPCGRNPSCNFALLCNQSMGTLQHV